MVDTSVEQQLQQASQRDNASKEAIQKIIQQQASRTERLAIADEVIHNTGNLNHLKQQLQTLITLIL